MFGRGLGNLIWDFDNAEQDICDATAKLAERVLTAWRIVCTGTRRKGKSQRGNQQQTEKLGFHTDSVTDR